MRCYREVYEYYIAEEEKTVAQIASEECVSEKTVYKDIGNACKIIAVYLLGV
jgi:DNA-binding CsgD family transcriptional regulator